MVSEAGACFLYRFLSIDAALRRNKRRLLRPTLNLKITSLCYVPVVRLLLKVNYWIGTFMISKLLDWYIYDGETYTKTEKDNPILKSISNRVCTASEL